MKNLILIILLSFTTVSLCFAGGPWPQQKGKGYFKLSEWWIVFSQHYTDAGLTDPNVTTGIFNTSLYIEYGLTDRLTAITNAPLFSRNYMNNLKSATTNEIIVPGESINSIGDIEVGLKLGLTKQGAKIPVAASLILGLPTGVASAGTLNNLQTGDGEFNQIIQIHAGHSFQIAKAPAYVSTYIGFNNRSNDFSEEFRYGLEFGIGLINKKLWLNTKLNVVESFKNGGTAETITSTSVFANNSEYTSIGLGINYYISSKLGVSVDVAGAFKGEIIAAAPSYSVGVFYDME